MHWVLLAIIGAVANAAYYIIIKNHITDRDPRIPTALGFFISGVLLLSISAVQGFPVIGPAYYSAIVISSVLNLVGLTLIFRAMESVPVHAHALLYTGLSHWHLLVPPA